MAKVLILVGGLDDLGLVNVRLSFVDRIVPKLQAAAPSVMVGSEQRRARSASACQPGFSSMQTKPMPGGQVMRHTRSQWIACLCGRGTRNSSIDLLYPPFWAAFHPGLGCFVEQHEDGGCEDAVGNGSH